MTIKETLVRLIQKEGYDFISACEHASTIIKEIQSRPDGVYTYGNEYGSITIKKENRI